MDGIKDELLQALKDFETEKPRNQQVRLGPSELGGCREYVRNVMVGTPQQDSDVWPTAAVVGTLLGTHLEDVSSHYLGAVTEVAVTTTLPNGLKVSGHADIVLVERNMVVDAKSKDKLHTVRREGASLENLVQVSIYTLGLVQAGVLDEGATASLIYVDRSGDQQELHEVVLTWEQILNYVDECIERLDYVLEVQDHVDNGEVEYARALRDKTPPFCYSPKVMCPFRDLCWKGSDWVPDEEITDEDTIATVAAYAASRDNVKAETHIKSELREKLVGVSGLTPGGLSVNWAGSEKSPALYVTQVKEPKAKK